MIRRLFDMKKMIAIAAILVSTMTMTTAVTAYAAETAQTTMRTIEVNGKGIVMAKPDVASIRFTVETKEYTAQEAQNKYADITDAVTKALVTSGVQSDNIITEYYTVDVDKTYDQQKDTWIEHGYYATNSFTAKVNDVDNVGKYIDVATKAGVTSVGSVSFSLSDPNQYYSQALQSAVKNASSSAQALAGALGVALGECISVEEISSYNSYIAENAVMAKSAMADTAASGADGGNRADIRYEDMEVSANVVMRYAY